MLWVPAYSEPGVFLRLFQHYSALRWDPKAITYNMHVFSHFFALHILPRKHLFITARKLLDICFKLEN